MLTERVSQTLRMLSATPSSLLRAGRVPQRTFLVPVRDDHRGRVSIVPDLDNAFARHTNLQPDRAAATKAACLVVGRGKREGEHPGC